MATLAKENKEKLEIAYGFLIGDVAEKLQQMEINFHAFRSYVSTYIKDNNHTLANTSTITDILQVLTSTTKWKCDSITALEEICKKIGRGNKDLMKMITDYKSKLAGFKATTKIIHYMTSMNSDQEEMEEFEPASSGIQQTMAEHDEKYCHKLSVKLKARVTEKCLDYVDDLWTSIVEYLYIPALPALLMKICDGCIEVTWRISSRTARDIKAQAWKFRKMAQKFDIISMKLDREILYLNNSQPQLGKEY